MSWIKIALLSVLLTLCGCVASEPQSTSPTFHQRWIAPNPNATTIPEYVTAWPKQVAVEKPDPVLGDKLVWEHWIYSEEFAKRFDGFPIEKADKELKSSPIKAIALRIYKENFWKGVNPSFPEQYATDIDLYFDDDIEIPLTQKERTPVKVDEFPKGVFPSFKQLKPFNSSDKDALQNAKETFLYPERPYRILVTPLDGRLSSLGGHYYPQLLKEISYIRLTARVLGGVTVPLQQNGTLWLSLFGKTPYYDDTDPRSNRVMTQLYQKTNTTFESGEHPEAKGYIKLPRSFYEIALPKMALIKVLNVCIADKQHLDKASKEAQKDLLMHCKEIEERGVIYDLHNNKYGLSGSSF